MEHIASSPPEVSDEGLCALVRGMAEGREDALNRLYDLMLARVNGLAIALLGNAEDAQEVVSDVFVQAWNTAGLFDRERGPVQGWLMTICRSRALDMIRRRAVRSRTLNEHGQQPRDEGPGGPEALLALVEEHSAVHEALSGLSDLRRQLLGLAFFRGLSHQEIAATVGLPLGTVKSHLRRALLALREHLEH